MAETSAVAYLSQVEHSFWKWGDRAQVAVWSGGGTIAFFAELDAIIQALAPSGLPPLESILLLMAACRPGWDTIDRSMLFDMARFHEPKMPTAGLSWRLIQQVRGPSPAAQSLLAGMQQSDHPLTVLLEAVLAGLDTVHSLPPELRSKLEAKVALAGIVFEPVRVRQEPEASAEVAAAIKAGLPGDALEADSAGRTASDDVPRSTRRFVDSLAALFQGLCAAPFSHEQVELRLRTGMDELPQAAPAETPAGQTVADLLGQIDQDQSFAGLSRLARDLMGVVYLPRRVSDDEQLPVGGFSDITNRGSLDRLLPGELAHDDLTLSVRVALNEAMYFRRETPPRNPLCHRRMLVDAGIRMWGVPRVFGAAVALAMAATGESHSQVDVCCTAGDHAEQVDLTTREGLVQLLESLDIEPQPGKHLNAFLGDKPGDGEVTDNILITHPDVLADPEFRQAVTDLGDQPLYIAAVDRDGSYCLERWTRVGRTVLRQAQMDLKGLFGGAGKKQVAETLIDAHYEPSLPVILAARPFPLLLPHAIDIKKTASNPDIGLLAITHDRRLMLWRKHQQAALQLSDSLPRGNVCWSGLLEDRAYVLVRSTCGLQLTESDLGGTTLTTRPLPCNTQPQGACLVGNRLCLVHPGLIVVVSLETGQVLDKVHCPAHIKWQRGRVFRDTSAWHVLGLDTSGVVLQPLPMHDDLTNDLLAIFERDGVDGLWAVFKTGEVVQVDGDNAARPTIIAANQFNSATISRDGNRLVLATIGDKNRLHMDLTAGTSHYRAHAQVADSFLEFRSNPSGGLRKNLSKIGGLGIQESCLCLRLASGTESCLLIAMDGASIKMRCVRTAASVRWIAGFAAVGRRPDVGYALKMATAADGSKVWVDGRGLMHLKSSDDAVPEATLVLVSNGTTAGWASDGTWYGPEYFIGDHESVDVQTFYQNIVRFVNRLA